MAKFIVLYEEPKDKEGFDAYYKETHIPLVGNMPNIKSTSIDYVVKQGDAPAGFYLHVEIEFETLDHLNAAFASEAGKQVMADGANLAPFLNSPPQVLITQ